jgi:hypothetical protein
VDDGQRSRSGRDCLGIEGKSDLRTEPTLREGSVEPHAQGHSSTAEAFVRTASSLTSTPL